MVTPCVSSSACKGAQKLPPRHLSYRPQKSALSAISIGASSCRFPVFRSTVCQLSKWTFRSFYCDTEFKMSEVDFLILTWKILHACALHPGLELEDAPGPELDKPCNCTFRTKYSGNYSFFYCNKSLPITYKRWERNITRSHTAVDT
jgi:hypothetical protein